MDYQLAQKTWSTDIIRFSILDNYWCLVSYYKLQNKKSLCKTFADRANQLLFIELCLETKLGDVTNASNPTEIHVCLECLHAACTLTEAIKIVSMEHVMDSPFPNGNIHLSDGVMVGKETLATLSTQKLADIA